jgi:hypothetical protein
MVEQGPSLDKAIFNADGTDTLAPGAGRDANYGIPAMGSDGTNIIITKMDADGKSISIMQGQFVDGVPTEITTDGEAASLLINAFRELIIAGYNRAEGAIDINNIAPALLTRMKQTGLTQLTAPAQTTDKFNIELRGIFGFSFTVASIGTNIVVQLKGSIDRTNYGVLPLDNTAVPSASITTNQMTITANGTYLIYSSAPVVDAYLEFVSESGGTPTIDPDFFARRI